MTDNVEAVKAEETVKAEESLNVKAEEAAKNPLEQSFDITVRAAELNAGVQAELKRLAKKAKMPGFRPGHVPFATVQAMYGSQAYSDTLNKLIDEAFRKGVEERKLNVAGPADCQPKGEIKPGEDLQFTLTFECFPEVKTPDLAALTLKRYVCPVTDEAVEKTIDIMVKQRVTYEEEAGRAAAAEDRVTINFKGTKDGEAFQGGSAENFGFVLAQGRMLPEFETAVTGMTAGQKKSFDLTFPANYGNAELAGKEVTFEVECLKVEKPIYPTVDDAFAKTLGLESVEQMKSEVRRNLEREVKARLLARTKQETLDAVLKAVDFKAPTMMVREEQQRLADAMVEQMKQYMPADRRKEVKPMPLDIFKEGAERNTRMGILCSTIVQENKITATQEAVKAYVDEMASAYEDPKAMAEWIMKDRNQLNQIAAMVMENNLVEFILGKAQTTEESVAFDELMGNRNAQ